jgi:hypothetical protein
MFDHPLNHLVDAGYLLLTLQNITIQWTQILSNTRAGANLLQSRPELLTPAHEQFGTSLEPPRVDDPFVFLSLS